MAQHIRFNYYRSHSNDKEDGTIFQEEGRLKNSTSLPPPTPQDLARFAAVSRKYGYWNVSHEENKMVGMYMSF